MSRRLERANEPALTASKMLARKRRRHVLGLSSDASRHDSRPELECWLLPTTGGGRPSIPILVEEHTYTLGTLPTDQGCAVTALTGRRPRAGERPRCLRSPSGATAISGTSQPSGGDA